MQTVYVQRIGAYVRKEGETLTVEKRGEQRTVIPTVGLTRMVIVGRVTVSGGALEFLVDRGVETLFLSRDGRFRARLGPEAKARPSLKQTQYRRFDDPNFCLRTARILVAGKLEGMRSFLLRRARQYQNPELKRTAADLVLLKKRLSEAADIDILRGIEGTASRTYFQCFHQLIRAPGFEFSGRNRKPPRDPVNALLSFTYTLLANEVQVAVAGTGLDPYWGVLHAPRSGSPSLALDLLEEFRCQLGDRFVLSLINRKILHPGDFENQIVPAPAGESSRSCCSVRMEEKPRKTYLAAFDAMMEEKTGLCRSANPVSPRALIRRRAETFASWLEGGQMDFPPQNWAG